MLTTEDLQHFDGLATVSLQPPGTLTTVDVSGALRRRASVREAAPSEGVVLAVDTIWHLPYAAAPSEPLPGTRIIDSESTVWTVLRADRESLASRWKCWARNLTLALGLEHVVQIERATWSKDATGAPVANWNLVQANVKARIQPIEATHALSEGQRFERVTHRVYLAEAMLLDESHRIVHAGVTYNVRGYAAPERIDEPLVVFTERAPWPWS